jgi:hypothetical protein
MPDDDPWNDERVAKVKRLIRSLYGVVRGHAMKPLRVGALMLSVAAVLTAPAHAETDVLLRAVGFALTGSDNAIVRPIDRAHCVFAIGRDIYRLNNVQTDRLGPKAWQRVNDNGVVLERWLTVELHGDDTVYETTDEPETPLTEADVNPKLAAALKSKDAEFFNRKPKPPEHHVFNETTLRPASNDQDRITRAWKYIYGNGCVGKSSPF